MGVGHNNVDLTPFDKANAGGKKLPWGERVSLIKQHFPSIEQVDWKAVFDKDIDIFAAIMSDILKADGATPGRSGPKPAVDHAEGAKRLRQLMGEDYSEVPFVESFRFLAGDRTIRHVASKTKINKARVYRLMCGEYPPTPSEMEQIAKAFGKEPGYFIEYRVDVVLCAMAKKFFEVPESTVKYYRQLAGK